MAQTRSFSASAEAAARADGSSSHGSCSSSSGASDSSVAQTVVPYAGGGGGGASDPASVFNAVPNEVLQAFRCTHGWFAFEEALNEFFSTQPGSFLAFLASQPASFLLLCTGCNVLEGGWSGNFVVSIYEPCALAHALSRTCRSLRAAFAFLRSVPTSWLQLASPLSKCAVHSRTAEAWHAHELLREHALADMSYVCYPQVRADAASFYLELLKEHATHDRETQSRLELATGFNPYVQEGRVNVGRVDVLKQLIVASVREDGQLGEPVQVLSASQLRRACADAGSVAVADALHRLFPDFPAEAGAHDEAYINFLVDRGANGDGFELLAAGPGSANARSAGGGGALARLREHLFTQNRNWASKLGALSSDGDLLSTLERAASVGDSGAPRLTQLLEVNGALLSVRKAMGKDYPQYVDAQMRLVLATQPSTQVICFALPGDMMATGSKKTEFVLSMLTAQLNRLRSVEVKLEDDVYGQLFGHQTGAALRMQIAAARMPADECAPSARATLSLLSKRGVASVCEDVAVCIGISEIANGIFESTFRRYLMSTVFSKHKKADLFRAPVLSGRLAPANPKVALCNDHSIGAALLLVLLRSHQAQDLCETEGQVRFLTSGTLQQMARYGSEGGLAVSRHYGWTAPTLGLDPTPPAASPPATSPPPSPPAAPSPLVQDVPAEPLQQTERQKRKARQADTQSTAQLAETARAAAVETHRRERVRHKCERQGISEPRYLSQRGPGGEQPPSMPPTAFAEGTVKQGADGTSMWIAEGISDKHGNLCTEWVLRPPKAARRERGRQQ